MHFLFELRRREFSRKFQSVSWANLEKNLDFLLPISPNILSSLTTSSPKVNSTSYLGPVCWFDTVLNSQQLQQSLCVCRRCDMDPGSGFTRSGPPAWSQMKPNTDSVSTSRRETAARRENIHRYSRQYSQVGSTDT